MDWQTLRICLKTGIAVGLAYLLTYGERSQYALYAVMTAALIVGENFGDDLNQSLVRLVGTLLGAALGVAFLISLGVEIWSVIACAVATAALSRLVKLEQLSRAALAVSMVTLLLHPDGVAAYGLYRIANTVIGAVIGLGVSLLIWPVRAEAAATQAVIHLLELSITVLKAARPPFGPGGRAASDRTLQQLAKVFKAIKDARREGQVFRTGATATAERVILGGQVGLGAVAIAAGCEHLAKNPGAAPFVDAVATIAAGLADRIRTLIAASPGEIASSPTDDPLELPTPPANANLSAAEGVLMAGVIGEIRVVISALAVLERLGTQPTKHEGADRGKDANREV